MLPSCGSMLQYEKSTFHVGRLSLHQALLHHGRSFDIAIVLPMGERNASFVGGLQDAQQPKAQSAIGFMFVCQQHLHNLFMEEGEPGDMKYISKRTEDLCCTWHRFGVIHKLLYYCRRLNTTCPARVQVHTTASPITLSAIR